MSKYTTLLFPAEDYHYIGPFRFPIYKDLAPGELKKFNAINKAQAAATYSSMRLAKKIAEDKGIKRSAAVELLSNASTEENQELLYDYIDEIEAVAASQADDTAQLVSYCTTMLQMRGEVKLPEADDYVACPDWTAEDTDNVPRKILQEIFEFIMRERDGWPEEEAGNSPESATQKKSS